MANDKTPPKRPLRRERVNALASTRRRRWLFVVAEGVAWRGWVGAATVAHLNRCRWYESMKTRGQKFCLWTYVCTMTKGYCMTKCGTKKLEVGPGPSPRSRVESRQVLVSPWIRTRHPQVRVQTFPLYIATYVCTLRKYRLFYVKSMFPPGKAACSPPKSAGYPDSAHASPSPGTHGSYPDSCPPGRLGLGTRFCDESESDPISTKKAPKRLYWRL